MTSLGPKKALQLWISVAAREEEQVGQKEISEQRSRAQNSHPGLGGEAFVSFSCHQFARAPVFTQLAWRAAWHQGPCWMGTQGPAEPQRAAGGPAPVLPPSFHFWLDVAKPEPELGRKDPGMLAKVSTTLARMRHSFPAGPQFWNGNCLAFVFSGDVHCFSPGMAMTPLFHKRTEPALCLGF